MIEVLDIKSGTCSVVTKLFIFSISQKIIICNSFTACDYLSVLKTMRHLAHSSQKIPKIEKDQTLK